MARCVPATMVVLVTCLLFGNAVCMGRDVIRPVTPKDAKPVSAEVIRDDRGRAFTKVTAQVEKVDLKKAILHMECPPSGREIYCIFEGEPGVHIIDPAIFKIKGMIRTPRSPTSIWCDEKQIVVTCKDSKVVTVLDSRKRRPVKAFQIRESAGLEPVKVMGVAADGAYMVTWRDSKRGHDLFLFHHDPKSGKSKLITRGDLVYVTYLPDNKHLIAQDNFGGSPSGAPDILLPVAGQDRASRISPSKILVNEKMEFHATFRHCFVTHDRKYVVMPTAVRGYGYNPWTYVIDFKTKRIKSNFPGCAIAEVPAKNMLVSWGQIYDKKKKASGPLVFYASTSTGRILRRIHITGIQPHPAAYSKTRANRAVLYVPGHELFIYRNYQARGNDKQFCHIIRCGPVAKELEQKADPSFHVKNDPPTKTKAGKEIKYTPGFKASGKRKVVFKLKEKIEGMTIDPKTGAWRWTPDDAWLGDYEITILAEIDGVDIEVITWILTID